MLAIYNEGKRMFTIEKQNEERKNHNHRKVTFIRNNFKFDTFLAQEVIDEIKPNLDKIKKSGIGVVFKSGVRMTFHNKTSEAIAIGSKEPGAMLLASLDLAADEKIVDVKIPRGVSILSRKFTKYKHLTFAVSFKPDTTGQVDIVRYHKESKKLSVTTIAYNGAGEFTAYTKPMAEGYQWREKYDNFRITTFKPFKPFHLIFVNRRHLNKCRELYGNKNYSIVDFVNIKDLYLKIGEWEEKGFIAASLFSNVEASRTTDDALAPLEGTEREIFSKFLYAVVKKFDKSSVVYNDGYVKITTDHKKLNRRHIALMKEREKNKVKPTTKGKVAPSKPVAPSVKTPAKDEVVKTGSVKSAVKEVPAALVDKAIASAKEKTVTLKSSSVDSVNVVSSISAVAVVTPSIDDVAGADLPAALANHFNSGRVTKKRENPKSKKKK